MNFLSKFFNNKMIIFQNYYLKNNILKLNNKKTILLDVGIIRVGVFTWFITF